MKLYRLFYDDATDLNGEKIEIGKTYTKENFDREELFAYFNLEDLCEEYDMDKTEQNFKIYEVDLFGEKCFPYEYSCKIYANKLQILNEVNYEEFCNNIFNEYLQEPLQVIKLKTDEILNKAITSKYNRCRAAVAIVGRNCDLDKLVYDESEFVQSIVLNHKRPQDIKALINSSDTKIEILLKIAEFDLDDECFENLLRRNYNNIIQKLFIKDKQRVIDFYKKNYSNHLSNKKIQLIITTLKDANIIYELRKSEDSETKLLLLKSLRSFTDAITFIVDEDENVRKLAFEILQDPENVIKYQKMINKILIRE